MRTRARRLRFALGCAAAVAVLAWWPVVVWLEASARTAIERRRLDDAARCIAWGRRLSFQAGPWHLLAASRLRAAGDLLGAQGELARARAAGVAPSLVRDHELLLAAQAGRMSEAGPHLARLLREGRLDGAEVSAAYIIGYLANLQLREAETLLDAWQKDAPDAGEPWFMRAHLRQLQSRGADAADCYRRGLEREPSRHEQREKLAETLLFLRQYAEAERELRACLERRTGDLKLLSMLAECRFHQGAVDEAAVLLTRLLESPGRRRGEPGADRAAGLLGEVLLAAGKPADAVEWLEELMPRRSWSAPDRYSLAMALQSSGRADEAAEHFQFVEQAENELAEMERQLVDVARQPQNAALRFSIARTLLKYGEPADALRWAESAAALDPASPECRALVQAARQRWNEHQQPQNGRP